jgi:hypothetical protein
MKQFFEKWLPANQHASDMRTRAVVEVTFPFEFHGYETWNIAFRIKFALPTNTDKFIPTGVECLKGHEFGPFWNWNQANTEIEKFYEDHVGKPYDIGDNCSDEMKAVIQSFRSSTPPNEPQP